MRLFLPEEWTTDPGLCAAAGVPHEAMAPRAKGEIALDDADCGAGAAFRHGLSERGLTWAVGIPRNQKNYDADVQLLPPAGRKRRPVRRSCTLTRGG